MSTDYDAQKSPLITDLEATNYSKLSQEEKDGTPSLAMTWMIVVELL